MDLLNLVLKKILNAPYKRCKVNKFLEDQSRWTTRLRGQGIKVKNRNRIIEAWAAVVEEVNTATKEVCHQWCLTWVVHQECPVSLHLMEWANTGKILTVKWANTALLHQWATRDRCPWEDNMAWIKVTDNRLVEDIQGKVRHTMEAIPHITNPPIQWSPALVCLQITWDMVNNLKAGIHRTWDMVNSHLISTQDRMDKVTKWTKATVAWTTIKGPTPEVLVPCTTACLAMVQTTQMEFQRILHQTHLFNRQVYIML